MKITKDSKIGLLIKQYPFLLDVLINYNPHFKLLKNPVLKNTIAKIATVQRASIVAGVSLRGLLKELNHAVGYELSHEELMSIPEFKRGPSEPPYEILNAKKEDIVRIDVREILRRGEEPFGQIMDVVKNLKDNQVFLLEVLFEPGPLYDVMERKGFLSYTEKVEDNYYKVYFYKKAVHVKNEESEKLDIESRKRVEGNKIFLNVKGLEPPQPMELILTVLKELKENQLLIIEHERKPVFLLPKLEERGFTYTIEEKNPSDVIITVKKT